MDIIRYLGYNVYATMSTSTTFGVHNTLLSYKCLYYFILPATKIPK